MERRACVYVCCLCEQDISCSASQKHWRDETYNITTTSSWLQTLKNVWFFSALVQLDPTLVKKWASGGKTNLEIYHLAYDLEGRDAWSTHCKLCVCVCISRSALCVRLVSALMETWLEPQSATLRSHYAGFAWTLTPNCLSPFQAWTHTHTHAAPCVLRHTCKMQKQALKDDLTCIYECRCTHTHTQNHVLIFIFAWIFNKHASSPLALTPPFLKRSAPRLFSSISSLSSPLSTLRML